MTIRKALLAGAIIAGLVGPAGANAQVSGAIQGVQRAAPVDTRANAQLTEVAPGFWIFVSMGVVVTGVALYEFNQDDDGLPKSP